MFGKKKRKKILDSAILIQDTRRESYRSILAYLICCRNDLQEQEEDFEDGLDAIIESIYDGVFDLYEYDTPEIEFRKYLDAQLENHIAHVRHDAAIREARIESEKETNEFFNKTINELEKEVEADLAGKKNEK